MAKITSVIDIGSNSVRMAIFKKTSRFGFNLIYEIKSKVRISEGSYENNGVLQKEPIDRTISVLKDFYQITKDYKSKKLFCVATSAVRDAPNRQEFVQLVKKQCNIQIKVLDGKKEAFFGGIACANLSHLKDGIMIDIGGGSTECVLIEKGRLKEMISLNIGTIRLKELFLDKKCSLKEMSLFIENEIAKIPASFKHENIFGVGGTIRALTKLIIKQSGDIVNMVHGFEIDIKKYSDLIQKIIKAKEEKLIEMGISEERLDNIQGGLLILSLLISTFKAKKITTCGVGIREGVFLADLLRYHHHQFPPNINPSIHFIKDTFPVSKNFPTIKKYALNFFNAIQEDFALEESYATILKTTAALLQTGVMIDFYQANNHASYMAKYMLTYGISHQDRAHIALLLEFSEKKLPKDSDLARYNITNNLSTLQVLSYILAISQILATSKQKEILWEYQNRILKFYGLKSHFLLREKISKVAIPKNLSVIIT